MKKKKIVMIFSLAVLMSCNNGAVNSERDDSISEADSANEQHRDSTNDLPPKAIDEKSADFLVRAANSAMTEIKMTGIAVQQASIQQVKDFAAMLEKDHQNLNEQIKSLAVKKNVTLPADFSNESKEEIDMLNGKAGKNFNKFFVKAMVNRHKESIRLYEEASKDANDVDIKTFAANSLVTLRLHLDSARALEKKY